VHVKSVLFYSKAVDVIIKLMMPFVVLALMIGLAKLIMDLGEVFQSSSVAYAFDKIVTNILSLFVVVELLKSLIDFFALHRLRITFIIDAALVFILREIMIGLYGHTLQPMSAFSLALLLLVLGAVRTLAIIYSPDKEKEKENVYEKQIS
jgi:uncharacterized membrane protein (DUF373 family)